MPVGCTDSSDEFASLRDMGRVALVRGVGYQSPDLSHFTSMGTWMQGWGGAPQSPSTGQPTDGNATDEKLVPELFEKRKLQLAATSMLAPLPETDASISPAPAGSWIAAEGTSAGTRTTPPS